MPSASLPNLHLMQPLLPNNIFPAAAFVGVVRALFSVLKETWVAWTSAYV
jgi:hypothetical protein